MSVIASIATVLLAFFMIQDVVSTSEVVPVPASSLTAVPEWGPATSPSASVQDLHREYGNIFKFGNRNAASHLWSSFLFDRAAAMNDERLELMFSGFCAISGSPTRPSDYTRYRLTLPLVSGEGNRSGYMYYCCWPCVCDTQDFIRVDTKNVTTASGTRQRHFAVIGNPCERQEALRVPFTQPFHNRGQTTLEREAPEVRCEDGMLRGATMSDHGYVILSLFFDAEQDEAGALEEAGRTPTPGKLSSSRGVSFQDESEYAPMCEQRAAAGYNSGMGEIFRKVAAISPVEIPTAACPTAELPAPESSQRH